MFCLTACSCTRRAASGLSVPTSFRSLPSAASVQARSGSWSASRSARGGQRGGVTEAHLDVVAVAADAGVAHVLVAQQRAHVAGEGLGLLRQRRLHVDLHQEVHAAAQVQAQVHRQRVQARQPGRRARHQVQRHDPARVGRVGVQRLRDRVLGLDLRVGVDGSARAPSCRRTARSPAAGRRPAGPARPAAPCPHRSSRWPCPRTPAPQAPRRTGWARCRAGRSAARPRGSRTSTRDSGSWGFLARGAHPGRRGATPGGLLEGALGQHLHDGAALHLQLDTIGDLDSRGSCRRAWRCGPPRHRR